MLIRRTLLVAAMVVLLWAAPAHAQPASYGATTAENETVTGIILGNDGDAVDGVDSLARTGQANVAPLVQLSLLLVGVGAALVFVARRQVFVSGKHYRQAS